MTTSCTACFSPDTHFRGNLLIFQEKLVIFAVYTIQNGAILVGMKLAPFSGEMTVAPLNP